MLTYLEEITIRLARGAAELPAPLREKHARYLKEAQRPDGGFAGREGGSDLYYTGFALRGLSILGELYGPVADRSAEFLRSRLASWETTIDLMSLVYGVALLEASAGIDVLADQKAAWSRSVMKTLEALRREDGGYAKGRRGAASSTYHTFLVLVCQQLLDTPTRQPERIVAFLDSQRCEGGGFREIRASKRAGTNPSAAAIGSLKILNSLRDDVGRETARFLVGMQVEEGGLRANTRIPIADLLSTFTGSLTLVDLASLDRLQIPAARRFVESLESAVGGFHGAAWDTTPDVEYTFYGIASLAFL
ncbi:MAG: prenyltransferase/squalene oxidase repeat-containing protein [Pirellulaceae bacterium]